MAETQGSEKRTAIIKANAQVVLVVSIASFIAVFCLVASYTIWKQNAYLGKVNTQKEAAKVQLTANLTAAQSLSKTYSKFTEATPNGIGGNRLGDGDRDGDNAKLVLDALPSSYDFPALASSLEKLLTSRSLTVSSIAGTDDQIAQQAAAASPNPAAVAIPFSFSVEQASYASIQDLIKTLHVSIRPIQIDTMSITGGGGNMSLSITAHTYFQPSKTVNITSGVVPQ